MATPSMTSSVYINVIEDVVSKVRDEFINNGPGETVVNELLVMWEMKMMQAGAISGPIERNSVPRKMMTPGSGATPVHDLNVPYEGPEEYETPTAEMLFPPTPLQTPAPTPLPGSADNSMYNIPTGNSDYPTPSPTPGNDNGVNAEIKGGRPGPFLPPPSPWMNQRPQLSVDVNVAYVEGSSRQPSTQDFLMMSAGKRKRDDFASQNSSNGDIPQQDGAGDATPDLIEIEISQGSSFGRIGGADAAERQALAHSLKSCAKIPQLDGPVADPYDEVLSTPNIYNYQGGENEDYNVAKTPAANEVQGSTPAVDTQDDVGEDDDDEPPLNEDDDDDLDEIDQQEESNTHYLVLAQFDKVTRTKSRWKCTLKDGIMHIQNKDVLFNKATGEFDF